MSKTTTTAALTLALGAALATVALPSIAADDMMRPPVATLLRKGETPCVCIASPESLRQLYNLAIVVLKESIEHLR